MSIKMQFKIKEMNLSFLEEKLGIYKSILLKNMNCKHLGKLECINKI